MPHPILGHSLSSRENPRSAQAGNRKGPGNYIFLALQGQDQEAERVAQSLDSSRSSIMIKRARQGEDQREVSGMDLWH